MATPFTFEARHSSTCEGERAAVHPNRKRSATANPSLANLYWTAPPMPGSPWVTNVQQTGRQRPLDRMSHFAMQQNSQNGPC